MTRQLALVTAGLLATAATAWAQEPLSIEVALSPDRAGAPSALTATFTARDVDRPPDAAAIFTPAGMRLDPRAVRVRCSDAAAERGECPATSRIGGGEVRAQTILGPVDFRGGAFLGVPRGGEHAAAWLALDGFRDAVRASVRRSGRGYVIRLGGLVDGAPQVPPGAISEISGTLRLDARSRTVTRTKTVRGKDGKRRRRKIRTTHHLLRNPSSCPAGGWTARAELTYGADVRSVATAVPCSR